MNPVTPNSPQIATANTTAQPTESGTNVELSPQEEKVVTAASHIIKTIPSVGKEPKLGRQGKVSIPKEAEGPRKRKGRDKYDETTFIPEFFLGKREIQRQKRQEKGSKPKSLLPSNSSLPSKPKAKRSSK